MTSIYIYTCIPYEETDSGKTRVVIVLVLVGFMTLAGVVSIIEFFFSFSFSIFLYIDYIYI